MLTSPLPNTENILLALILAHQNREKKMFCFILVVSNIFQSHRKFPK